MLRHAVDLADATEVRFQEARSHAGLARALAEDDPAAARRHGRYALSLFRDMGVPERFEVEKWLTEL
jgi:hypothetical protein